MGTKTTADCVRDSEGKGEGLEGTGDCARENLRRSPRTSHSRSTAVRGLLWAPTTGAGIRRHRTGDEKRGRSKKK